MSLARRFIFAVLLCVVLANTDSEKAAAKEYAKALVADKTYEEKTKDIVLKEVSSTLKGLSATKPISVKPSQQTNEVFKNLSESELKQVKRLYEKMSLISMQISRIIPQLESDRKMGRRGKDSIEMLRSSIGQLEKLKPQLRALEERFPHATEVLQTLKQLQKQVEAVVEDEVRVKTAKQNKETVATKAKAKEDKAKIPVGIRNGQCAQGTCCNVATYKFTESGIGCRASECVTSMTCLGNSEICPSGTPLADGTACSKGRCMSGLCIKEEKLETSCTSGPCCNLSSGKPKSAGLPCDFPVDGCLEPAAMCAGNTTECMATRKPENALCIVDGEEGTCTMGICIKTEYEDAASAEIGEGRKKLAELAEKRKLKERKRKHEFEELKHLTRRFGVLLWMNTKLDNFAAQKTASEYAATASGVTPDILGHLNGNNNKKDQLTPDTDPNRLWNEYLSVVNSNSETSTASTTYTTSTTSNLMSGTTSGTSSYGIGFSLIGIGLILIVAYFIFGGKKAKKEPQVIY